MFDGQRLRFRLEMQPLDMSTLVEILDRSGMAFDNKLDRDAFLKEIQNDPISIYLGTALRHARGTFLGVWGDAEVLRHDCAEMMAAELCRYQAAKQLGLVPGHETKSQLSKDNRLAHPRREFELRVFTPEEVLRSETFNRAYGIARAPKEAALHNFVRGLGNNASHMDFVTVPASRTLLTLYDVYEGIIADLASRHGAELPKGKYAMIPLE
ncbi:MAG: hypothetical protein HY438_03305 [DPANN group archaeon]|nr:hypothetical protein [DPANN group archaeon]